nr:hypothetical protein [uncultured Acetatifactor sp.]
MGRYYRLSKKLTVGQAEEIANKIGQIENVESVAVTREGSFLEVEVKNGNFSEVMGKAVNICSRSGAGAELSFAGFNDKISQ